MAESLDPVLGSDRYALNHFKDADRFLEFVEREKQQLDCLILQADPSLKLLSHRLQEQATLLPALILHLDSRSPTSLDTATDPELSDGILNSVKRNQNGEPISSPVVYHTAEIHISSFQLSEIGDSIEQAIAHFINFSPLSGDVAEPGIISNSAPNPSTQHFLLPQQRRLAEKLRERLGYLGVYYKRKPQRFLRNLPPAERQQFLEELKSEYGEVILIYFSNDSTLNQKIDDFVNTAFLADISVTQIMEIHMDLMDEFSKQLKLEGRSEEILLDYRLTLIDIIAHLCEMYRRSIPRDS